jgi:membrane associated rhomboid family serine protease
MLDDRYYMRRSPFDTRRSVTLALIVINAVIFVIQSALVQFAPALAVQYYAYGALSLEGLEHGFVWQLLTYQFMHANFMHILFNCWAIYVFGLDVENALGRKVFLTLYLSSGVLGGLLQALAGLATMRFGGEVVGASAAAFGLTAAFAVLFPDRVLLLFFIIPMRAKFLLLLCAILAVMGILAPQGGNFGGPRVADVAHLGGMLTGFLFVRYAIHWDWHWPQLRNRRDSPATRLVRVKSGASALWGRGKASQTEDLPADEFLSREVDPILDKISAHGIQSLTERERRILQTARDKMAKK